VDEGLVIEDESPAKAIFFIEHLESIHATDFKTSTTSSTATVDLETVVKDEAVTVVAEEGSLIEGEVAYEAVAVIADGVEEEAG
jgi:hypothetical protein